MIELSLATKLEPRIDVRGPEECWPWKGARNKRGYGVLFLGQELRMVLAHRAAFAAAACIEAFRKEKRWDANAMVVLHRCDNPPCCNPRHLFIGTHLDNVKDKVNKGRTPRGDQSSARRYRDRLPHGERHWKTTLTERQVKLIRLLHASGRTQASLGNEFGVSFRTVNQIVNRKRWGHV